MSADYQVYLYSNTREGLLVPPDQYTRLEYVNRVNGLGYVRLDLDASKLPVGIDLERLAVDSRIVVWRKPDGQRNAIDFAGVARFGQFTLEGQEISTNLRGASYNELLARRIIAFAAGSDEASKSGAADDIIEELVDENLFAPADADRDISDQGFSRSAALGTGTALSIAFSRSNLLDVLLKIHDQSRSTIATSAWYGFVPTIDGTTARFDVRTGRWGNDHRYPDGEHGAIQFGVEFGNMTNPSYIIDRRDEHNYIYSAGQGERDVRVEGDPQFDIDRINESPLNRREGFFDGRNYETDAELERAARERLRQGRPVRALSFQALETASCRYGIHWGVGDLVTASFAGIIRDYVISGVRVVVKAGRDTVTSVFEEYI